jgi:hypothetical protein
MRTGEYILCAAIHYKNGEKYIHQPINIETGFVLAGRRHHNIINTVGLAFGKMKCYKEQGFLTSTDRFVNRKEAAEIAYYSQQTDVKKVELYSEDLY